MNAVAVRCAEMLHSCEKLLKEAGQEAFVFRPALLNGSTVGMHFRHVLEFFMLLDERMSTSINYDLRRRDSVLENELEAALSQSAHLRERLESGVFRDTSLTLDWQYEEDKVAIATSLHRELAYNLEHLVHHMALIRIGLQLAKPDLEIPEDFGLANSTRRYRSQKA